MRQRLQETDPSVSFIARTNRSPAALMCGLNARVMSLSYANRGIRDGVTEERALIRATDEGGARLVVDRVIAVVLDYVLPFSDDGADGAGCGGLDT